MNKKLNTVLFILAASVGNIIVMVLLMTLLFALASMLLPSSLGSGIAQVVFLLIFVASIAGSFFVYHRFVGFLSKKIDMDKYFHPIFKRKG